MPTFASRVVSRATYLWPHSVRCLRQWMNRAGGSVLRDRGPAGPAQDGTGRPPFLIRKKDPTAPPTAAQRLPGENFCWCRRPLPSPHHLFSSNPPTHAQRAPSPPLGAILAVQRSFCFGGDVVQPGLEEGRGGETQPLLTAVGTRVKSKASLERRKHGGEILLRAVLDYVCGSLSMDIKSTFLHARPQLHQFWGSVGGSGRGRNAINLSAPCSLTSCVLWKAVRPSVRQKPENVNRRFTGEKQRSQRLDGFKAALPSG